MTSNPLILGFDVLEDLKLAEMWYIITNTEAIAVNQAWNGHPGQLAKELPLANGTSVQVWSKSLSNNKVAAFFISNQTMFASYTTYSINLNELNITSGSASVRDVWLHKDLGTVKNQLVTDPFGFHDSRFYILTGQ